MRGQLKHALGYVETPFFLVDMPIFFLNNIFNYLNVKHYNQYVMISALGGMPCSSATLRHGRPCVDYRPNSSRDLFILGLFCV